MLQVGIFGISLFNTVLRSAKNMEAIATELGSSMQKISLQGLTNKYLAYSS